MASESGAIALLKRAVEMDSKKQFTSALVCYKEGLQMLMEVIRLENLEANKKARFREKASEYMNRAEALQRVIDNAKLAGNFHEQVEIENDSIGHSYDSLFGRFLTPEVTSVHLEDPYIRAHHQVVNFLRLCELLVKKCPNLKRVHLVTGTDTSPTQVQEQRSKLEEITLNLGFRNVDLTYEFSQTLHDRHLRLDNGWVIKIGRGLDIYKSPKGKFSLGSYDLDLRPCLQTTVDIYHGKSAQIRTSQS